MKNLEEITILKNLGKVLDDYCELNGKRSGEWIGYNAKDPN